MGVCNSGVSNGAAVGPTPAGRTVAPVAGGIFLAAAGDRAVVFVANAASPGGPDTGGLFSLSGTFTGATVQVDFVPDAANWAAGNWQPLQSAIRNDTNAFVTGPFQLASSTPLQVNPGPVQGLYAVSVKLVSISTGQVLVNGFTNPGSVAGVESQILAQDIGMAALLRANAIGMSLLLDVDLMALAGSSF